MAPIWRSKLGGEFPRELIDRLDAEHIGTLRKLRAEPHNARCADCGRVNNTWASVNLGVFLCDRCADVHRALGTHLSKVKSCTGCELWGPDEISRMEELDLVLPNKQIHCGTDADAEPSKKDLMDHCFRKYGMKTVVYEKPSVCKKALVTPSSGMKIAGVSKNGWNDPFSEVGMHAAEAVLSTNSSSSPIVPRSQDGSSDHGKPNQPPPVATREFDFDDFFADMEPNTALAEVKDCVEEVEEVDTIGSMPDVDQLDMVSDKQLPNTNGCVNDLFEAYSSAVPGSTLAPPPPGAAKRMSTDEMWKHFDL